MAILNPTERFSNRAENYARCRPSYPHALIDLLFSDIGLSKDSVVADVGSGTGIFSRLLLERGVQVHGVEPNNEMRRAAENLLSGYGGFHSVIGRAEATPLEGNSVDYVTSAQAFHWFDRDLSRKEFERILRPGGKVVLIWNRPVIESAGFQYEYREMLKRFSKDYTEVVKITTRGEDLLTFYKDGHLSCRVFKNEQVFDFGGLVGRLLSSSYVPLPGEENYETIMETLREIFDKHQANGKVVFSYETEIFWGEL